MKLADIMEQSQVQIEQSIGKQIDDNTSKMERHVKDILDQNRLLFRNAIREATADSITTYDVNDMRAVLQSQKIALEDALTKNARLVAENSELRMHLSFMPIEYRDHVEQLQAKDHQLYRNQRREPQVIIPETDHKLSAMRSTWNLPQWQTSTCNSPFAMRRSPCSDGQRFRIKSKTHH